MQHSIPSPWKKKKKMQNSARVRGVPPGPGADSSNHIITQPRPQPRAQFAGGLVTQPVVPFKEYSAQVVKLLHGSKRLAGE